MHKVIQFAVIAQGADNSKLVHCSVLRLHVYFRYFYLTNIDVIDQKNNSYQAEFNFIHFFFYIFLTFANDDIVSLKSKLDALSQNKLKPHF